MMRTVIKILVIKILLLLWLAPVHAQLAAHLFANTGESSLVHHVSDPLVLRFSVTNDSALRTMHLNSANKETLVNIEASEAFQTLPDTAKLALRERYSLKEIAVVTFDQQFNWQQSVSLEVRDEQDQKWNLQAQVVALSELDKGVITLDGTQGITLKLAISRSQLAGLPQGAYKIAAVLATPALTKPETYSNSFTLELIEPTIDDNHQFSDLWYSNKTEYLLVTREFADAKKWATLWASEYPANAQAWTALGDAEYGLNNKVAAISAYQESEQQFRIKNGNQPQEIPELLIEKLRKARELPGPNVLPSSTGEAGSNVNQPSQ